MFQRFFYANTHYVLTSLLVSLSSPFCGASECRDVFAAQRETSAQHDLTRALAQNGYSESVAKRLTEYAPELAQKILSSPNSQMIKVYRGVPTAPKYLNPYGDQVWVAGSIDQASEYAEGLARSGMVRVYDSWGDLRSNGYRYWATIIEMEVPAASLNLGFDQDLSSNSDFKAQLSFSKTFAIPYVDPRIFISALHVQDLSKGKQNFSRGRTRIRVPFEDLNDTFGVDYTPNERRAVEEQPWWIR